MTHHILIHQGTARYFDKLEASVEFEDQRKARWMIWNDDDVVPPSEQADFETFIPKDGIYCINLNAEVEVRWQYRKRGIWKEADDEMEAAQYHEYRRVAVLKKVKP